MNLSRWTRRAALVGVATTLAVATTAGVSSAAVDPDSAPGTSMALAGADIARFQALAAKNMALFNAAHPNITCDLPKAFGAAVLPGADTPVATVKGTDVMEAEGHCFSATGEKFTVYLNARVEYRDASGVWRPTGCYTYGSGSSVNGVGTAIAEPKVCGYAAGAGGPGLPHAVHAFVTTDRFPDVYEGWSMEWQG